MLSMVPLFVIRSTRGDKMRATANPMLLLLLVCREAAEAGTGVRGESQQPPHPPPVDLAPKGTTLTFRYWRSRPLSWLYHRTTTVFSSRF